MSEELKPAAVHDANVFLPGSLGPVRHEVVLAYEHDRVVDQLRAKLAALKARQGEAVAYFSEESFSSNGTSDIITCNLPIGTALYTAPPASADAVPVSRYQLTRALDQLNRLGFGGVSYVRILRALLAQSESEGGGSMSGVNRFEAHYLTEGVMGGKALACAEMVLASDYDRDMQALRDDYNEACADAMQVAGKLQEVEAERDAALKQVEILKAELSNERS